MNVETPQCAYIGLGAMGIEIAKHIHRHLCQTNQKPLLVFNRTRARAEQLQSELSDVKIADSLESCASQADIFFTCLLNDAVVQDTVRQLLAHGLKPGSILVEQSTIAPEVGQALADEAAKVGVHYMACPVMGPPLKAAAAQLVVLMSGATPAVRAKVQKLLVPVIGPKVIDLGDPARSALKLKLTGNFFITSFVEMLAEGMTLGEAAGVGQDKVKELIEALCPGTVLVGYADRMLRNTIKSKIYFPISTARKDATHILNMAENAHADLPITRTFVEHINEVQDEFGDLDIAGAVLGQ